MEVKRNSRGGKVCDKVDQSKAPGDLKEIVCKLTY